LDGVTFPVVDEQARPEGLIGLDLESREQLLPPGQAAAGWLFALEKATYGVADHSLAIVAPGVLSFFTLYSILGAIGLEVAVGLAAPRLEGAALSRLISLGAREVFVLAECAGGLEAEGVRLHRLPPLRETEAPERALERLEEIAGLTRSEDVRWMLRQAVAARRDQLQRTGPGDVPGR
jgi:hypothetical protein